MTVILPIKAMSEGNIEVSYNFGICTVDSSLKITVSDTSAVRDFDCSFLPVGTYIAELISDKGLQLSNIKFTIKH